MTREEIELTFRSVRLAFDIGDHATATSRSYYAVFHAARIYLDAHHREETVDVRTHTGLISRFGELAVRTDGLPARYGKIFNNMHTDRLSADYGATPSAEEARRQIDDAREFVSFVLGKVPQ